MGTKPILKMSAPL